ncbi:Uncharacterised protein [Mycobacteroides abscessus subsp. abscessus]|nr:Uncharacterised protein [Mycobacteroides abscessus subsp. abscessus]
MKALIKMGDTARTASQNGMISTKSCTRSSWIKILLINAIA